MTGEPFADLMRRVVLDPLEMEPSTYTQPLPAALHALVATGHDDNGQPLSERWMVYPEQAAAGLWTTPTALMRVVSEMLRPHRVLDERTRDEMLAPQTDDHSALGWGLDDPWFQHGGSNYGFRALCCGSVTHRVGAAVMTNGEGGGVLCADVMATVAEAFGWPDYLKERTAIELDRATLDEVCGSYELEASGEVVEVVIRRDGDTLLASIPSVEEAELFASSPTRFFLAVDLEIEWKGDELEIISGATTLAAKRKPS